MKQLRPICLASASPRRAELLERYGLAFVRCHPRVDERLLPGEAPEAHVARLAARKAEAALAEHGDHLIVAGDTVVVHGGVVLGKPDSPQDAERMLTLLSGQTHRVLSACVLLDGPSGTRLERCVETLVTFRELPAPWIRWYSRLDECRDKAGAYGIQGIGGAMVARIEGSYNNVMGLPVEAIVWDLLDMGWVAL